MNRSSKRLEEIFESAWQMKEAQGKLEGKDRKRIDVIREASSRECPVECSGQWLECAQHLDVKWKLPGAFLKNFEGKNKGLPFSIFFLKIQTIFCKIYETNLDFGPPFPQFSVGVH